MTVSDGVHISWKEYERLQRAAALLQALRDWGVDNWEGYGEAVRSLEEENVE